MSTKNNELYMHSRDKVIKISVKQGKKLASGMGRAVKFTGGYTLNKTSNFVYSKMPAAERMHLQKSVTRIQAGVKYSNKAFFKMGKLGSSGTKGVAATGRISSNISDHEAQNLQNRSLEDHTEQEIQQYVYAAGLSGHGGQWAKEKYYKNSIKLKKIHKEKEMKQAGSSIHSYQQTMNDYSAGNAARRRKEPQIKEVHYRQAIHNETLTKKRNILKPSKDKMPQDMTKKMASKSFKNRNNTVGEKSWAAGTKKTGSVDSHFNNSIKMSKKDINKENNIQLSGFKAMRAGASSEKKASGSLKQVKKTESVKKAQSQQIKKFQIKWFSSKSKGVVKNKVVGIAKKAGKAILAAAKRKIAGIAIGGLFSLLMLVLPGVIILVIIDSPKILIDMVLGGNEDPDQELIENTLIPVAEALEKMYGDFVLEVQESAKLTDGDNGLSVPPTDTMILFPDNTTAMPNFIDVYLLYLYRLDSFRNDESMDYELLKGTFHEMCYYTSFYQILDQGGEEVCQKVTKVYYCQLTDLIQTGTNDNTVRQAAALDPERKRSLMKLLGMETWDPGNAEVPENLNDLLDRVENPEIKLVISGAISVIGTPYSQAYRHMQGYFDCSSLTARMYHRIGINLGYGGSDTAASQAQGLSAAGKTVSYDDLKPGDLIFYSFGANGRFMNIDHVALYVGNGLIIDTSSNMGSVQCRAVVAPENIVLCGRPLVEIPNTESSPSP